VGETFAADCDLPCVSCKPCKLGGWFSCRETALCGGEAPYLKNVSMRIKEGMFVIAVYADGEGGLCDF